MNWREPNMEPYLNTRKRVRPDAAMQAKLDACIIDPTAENRGLRGSQSDADGRTYCGVPRKGSAKHAFNMRGVRGEKSKFDSIHSAPGEASEKGDFAKRLAALEATLGPPVIALKG